jgi:hypothetical protein
MELHHSPERREKLIKLFLRNSLVLPHCNNSPRRLNHASPSLRGLRGSLRGELNERLAACQAASRALGVVPGGAGWHEEKSAFKIL